MKAGTRSRSLLSVFHGKLAFVAFACAANLLLLAPASFIASQSVAQPVHPSQNEAEAAYLYNFGKFVRWPVDQQNQALNICVLGKDPFGPILDHITANELIRGRRLAVIRSSSMDAIQSCSMLFISNSEAPRMKRELSSLAALPIMTVSDMPGFVDGGGMVQFLLVDDRVRFEVNLNAANKSGLVFSSQLLKVAVHVVGEPGGKGR